jgi:hypothetical protein
MDLDRLVSSLITSNAHQNIYLRAIRLFEFQTAIFRPYSFAKLMIQDGVPVKGFKTARVLAAVKILEALGAELKRKNNNSPVLIRELAANDDYASVYDDFF